MTEHEQKRLQWPAVNGPTRAPLETYSTACLRDLQAAVEKIIWDRYWNKA